MAVFIAAGDYCRVAGDLSNHYDQPYRVEHTVALRTVGGRPLSGLPPLVITLWFLDMVTPI